MMRSALMPLRHRRRAADNRNRRRRNSSDDTAICPCCVFPVGVAAVGAALAFTSVSCPPEATRDRSAVLVCSAVVVCASVIGRDTARPGARLPAA